MITLYVNSDHATPAVMNSLRALADRYTADDPSFCGMVIEVEKGDCTHIDADDNVDGYDAQGFFNEANAIIQGESA